MNPGGTHGGLEGGTPRSAEDARTGGAEVHGGLHAGGAPGGGTSAMGEMGRSGASTEYGALGFSSTAEAEGVVDRATSRIGGMVDDVKERAQDLGGRAQELAGQARERAGEVADQARERLGDAVGKAQTFLDDQGVTDRIRQNPMPALGIAFGLGFLLAGRSEHKGVVGKARGELRHAILGGVTAVVAREARGYLGNVAGDGLIGQLLGHQGGTGAGAAVHRPPSHREQS